MKQTVLVFMLFLSSVYSWGQMKNGVGSADQLREHVMFLSADSLKGRSAGSPGEACAAEYLYDRMEEAGLLMLTERPGQDFFIVENGDTLHSSNVVGMIEGCDENLRNQFVVVGANLDHIGANRLTVDGRPVLQTYPGANDNASGIAAIIEVARRAAGSSFLFRRSVLFAGFGAKEKGMAGSWYFVNRAFPEIDSVSLMINLTSVGRTGPDNRFRYFTGAPSPEIRHMVEELSASSVYLLPEPGTGTLPQADYLPFYDRSVPVMLFTTGYCPDNRTVRDIPSALDYEMMDLMDDFIFNFILAAANSDRMVDRTSAPASLSDENDPEGRIYSAYEIDVAPKFFRGNEYTFLNDWVYTYLRYPEEAIDQGIQGVVTVEFIIEKDGTVTHVRVAKGNDPYLEDEAVRVVSASPKWKPGTLGGEKVRVKYSIPVEFRLKKRKH